MELTVPVALLAGIVSFASPCFLPIVPVFVGQLVGSGPGRVDRRVALGNGYDDIAYLLKDVELNSSKVQSSVKVPCS